MSNSFGVLPVLDPAENCTAITLRVVESMKETQVIFLIGTCKIAFIIYHTNYLSFSGDACLHCSF